MLEECRDDADSVITGISRCVLIYSLHSDLIYGDGYIGREREVEIGTTVGDGTYSAVNYLGSGWCKL